nr:hypothetical protein [Kibdelosporangium sp. MJ126-NF4]CTQ94027.1 hypothetical protein [Kibdelosporangium sp. MJ126-NF4]
MQGGAGLCDQQSPCWTNFAGSTRRAVETAPAIRTKNNGPAGPARSTCYHRWCSANAN